LEEKGKKAFLLKSEFGEFSELVPPCELLKIMDRVNLPLGDIYPISPAQRDKNTPYASEPVIKKKTAQYAKLLASQLGCLLSHWLMIKITFNR
jgi:hypothetical protein